jgi:glyoxylase-like metal-dependent hydrolase (beta-lactamase superfamily II)
MNKEPILVEISIKSKGFQKFICSWIICYNGNNVVIDVGPSSAVHSLIKTIKGMGIDTVDLVFLTHIHLDHAGGLGEFLRSYPMAKVVCHRKGIPHLINPERLWKGSKIALGKIAQIYGIPEPIPPEYLISHEDVSMDGLRIIETPGHAPHHLSFIYSRMLFPGEAGGNRFTMENGIYMRPATPPPFLLDQFLKSIETLLEEGDMPMYLPHFGRVDSSIEYLRRFKRQVLLWEELVSKIVCQYHNSKDLDSRCLEKIMREDHELRNFHLLPQDCMERERFFLKNSISGYIGYIKKRFQID